MSQDTVSRSVILISILIVGASLLTIPYLHEYTQLSICSIEGISGELYYYQGHITAACSAERTWDDLFELSGGIVLGLAFLGVFALSLSQKWKIGILSSLPIASFQFMEAYISNAKGFMHASFPHLVPVTWIIVSAIVFLAMMYVLPKLVSIKIPKLRNFSIYYLIILSTVTLGLIMHNIFLPEEVTDWKATAITIAAAGILYVAKHKNINKEKVSSHTFIEKNKTNYSHIYS